MSLDRKSTSLKPGLQALKKDLMPKLPPLENVSLNMPMDTNTKQSSEETPRQESDTSILDQLVVEHIRTPKFKKFEKQCNQQIQEAGALISLFSPVDGFTTVQQSDVLADKITGYAEVNAKFYNAINNLLNASPLIQLVGAVVGFAGALASNHGVNPIENAMKKRMEKMNANGFVPGMAKNL